MKKEEEQNEKKFLKDEWEWGVIYLGIVIMDRSKNGKGETQSWKQNIYRRRRNLIHNYV